MSQRPREARTDKKIQGDLLIEASAIYGLAFLSLKRPFEAERLLRYVVSGLPDHLEAQAQAWRRLRLPIKGL